VDALHSLCDGLLCGIVIATQFGAVTALLLETAVTRGRRTGAAAGLGVATVDLLFATVAAIAGGAVRTGLARDAREVRAAAAVTLGCIAVWGLLGVLSDRRRVDAAGAQAGANEPPGGSPSVEYVRFLALTAINPLTVVYFASVATSLSLTGIVAQAAFAAGAGAASAGWHLVLSLVAAGAGRRLTPRRRRAVAVAGRLIVLGMALRFALGV
jgi:threonine/homoserine/homoserine lactone efflux protein